MTKKKQKIYNTLGTTYKTQDLSIRTPTKTWEAQKHVAVPHRNYKLKENDFQ